MGRIFAEELASGIGGITLERGVAIHMAGNLYPPPPSYMVPVAIEALNSILIEDDWEKEIDLPDGVEWRGEKKVPARFVIDAFRLEAFLDGEDEE